MCASNYTNDYLDYDDAANPVRRVNQQRTEDNIAAESLRNGSGCRKEERLDQQFNVKLLIQPFDKRHPFR